MSQLNIFKGREKKEAGIKKAMDSAGEEWCQLAFLYLRRYAQDHKSFMAEQVRSDAETRILLRAPSKRAWGGIFKKAKRMGIIKHVGYNQVNNPKAHMANASIWKSLIYKK